MAAAWEWQRRVEVVVPVVCLMVASGWVATSCLLCPLWAAAVDRVPGLFFGALQINLPSGFTGLFVLEESYYTNLTTGTTRANPM